MHNLNFLTEVEVWSRDLTSLFKKFLPKANESSYATRHLRNVIRVPNYPYKHTFRVFICKRKFPERVPVKVVWSPERVPEVRCSVRTLIRFRQKFLKLNTLLKLNKLHFSGNFRKNISGNCWK